MGSLTSILRRLRFWLGLGEHLHVLQHPLGVLVVHALQHNPVHGTAYSAGRSGLVITSITWAGAASISIDLWTLVTVRLLT